jgi:hypothetical protein
MAFQGTYNFQPPGAIDIDKFRETALDPFQDFVKEVHAYTLTEAGDTTAEGHTFILKFKLPTGFFVDIKGWEIHRNCSHFYIDDWAVEVSCCIGQSITPAFPTNDELKEEDQILLHDQFASFGAAPVANHPLRISSDVGRVLIQNEVTIYIKNIGITDPSDHDFAIYSIVKMFYSFKELDMASIEAFLWARATLSSL